MKKQKYSLTSKERKKKNQINKSSNKSPPVLNDEQLMLNSMKKQRLSVILIISGFFLVVILLVSSVIVPFIIYKINPFYGTDAVIARMKLSNGMVLDFEIFEDECPNAATNFIFLARNKVFDGTIIYDNQNGWVRFSDYINENQRRTQNAEYVQNFSAITRSHKFNYRLRQDSSAIAKSYADEGVLCYLYQQEISTDFQVTSKAGALNYLQNASGQTKTLNPTVFGKYYNEQTLENLRQISQMERAVVSDNIYWRKPLPSITIQSVKVYNLDDNKWSNFNFETYMYGINAIEYW